MDNDTIITLILISLTFIIFTVHYIIFINYIVDDAGITFASAKTLVDYGRLSIDRYAEVVESYSNPLMVLILSGLYISGFQIIPSAKILNYFLGIITMGIIFLISYRFGKSSKLWLNVTGALLLALTTGFIIWSDAGLENGLYAFLIATSIYSILKFEDKSQAVYIIISSFLLAITRPEGILIALFIFAAFFLRNPKVNHKKILLPIASLILFYSLFIAARYELYSWIYPNTYYAKIGSSHIVNIITGIHYILDFIYHYITLFALIIALMLIATNSIEMSSNGRYNKCSIGTRNKVIAILFGFLVSLTIVWLYVVFIISPHMDEYIRGYISDIATISGTAIISISVVMLLIYALKNDLLYHVIKRAVILYNVLSNNRIIWYASFVALANLIYVLFVGETWGISRFLTPVLISLAVVLSELSKYGFTLYMQSKKSWHITGLISILFALFVFQMLYNTIYMYNNPIVSFWTIKEGRADIGNNIGGYLISNGYLPNAKHVTYMVPDIGATAFYADNYTIIDSAKLANIPLAHNQYEHTFFENYIFHVVKPVIIETHDIWSYQTDLLNYTEFNNNYVLVYGQGNITYYGKRVATGYYIRKDLFIAGEDTPINSNDTYLVLKGFNISANVLSRDGVLEINTIWQKTASCNDKIANNNELHIYLRNPTDSYLIDSHSITGGYYTPDKWDLSTLVIDKRTIDLKNVINGNYTLDADIIFPDGKSVSYLLGNVTVISDYKDIEQRYNTTLFESLYSNNYTNAEIVLKQIKGLNKQIYILYNNIILKKKLDYIDTLIDDGQLDQAYTNLYPFVGSEHLDIPIKSQFQSTQSKLSFLLEKRGKILESENHLKDAINSYEMSMWLNPDNSRLRRHIEELRKKLL
ncbi:MAG: hypothetical protein QMC99_05855 [Methanocella conradii]|nr:hypothetical protein [Methanocella conradii]